MNLFISILTAALTSLVVDPVPLEELLYQPEH